MKVIDYILKRLKEREERGVKKYGVTIDEGKPPTGVWLLEVNEELLDALVYQTKESIEKEKKLVELESRVEILQRKLDELEEYSAIHKELKYENDGIGDN